MRHGPFKLRSIPDGTVLQTAEGILRNEREPFDSRILTTLFRSLHSRTPGRRNCPFRQKSEDDGARLPETPAPGHRTS